MKVLIGAAAAMMLFAAAASAQDAPAASTAPVAPSACGDLPPDPALPDGATVDSAGMDAANTIYLAWATSVQSVARCRAAEYEAALATARARRDEHNAAAERLNAVGVQWTAQSEIYCARPRMRCERTPAQ